MVDKHKCIKCDKEFFECELQPTGTRAVPNEDPKLRGKIDYVFYNYICKECLAKDKENNGKSE